MRINHVLVALMITCIFGLNYSAIKLGLGSFDPLLLAGLRFSLCAFPAIFFAKKPTCHFKYVAVYGVSISLGCGQFYSACTRVCRRASLRSFCSWAHS